MSTVAQPQPRTSHPHRRLIIAGFLAIPCAVFVTANMLEFQFGVGTAGTWLDGAWDIPGLGPVLSLLILLGPVVALILALTWIFPLRAERDGDAWEVRIRVRPHPAALIIAAVSLLSGGILATYLVADNIPCLAGVAEGCWPG